jgi:mRNA-degrading endonuclease RelE of RelBE toxin-antitoxin system
MIFIETSLFSKLLSKYLSDDEYLALQMHLIDHPNIGDIIRGSGGVRKIRWSTGGRGKSSGIRVIYYWKTAHAEIWLLTLYAKNEKESIPAHVLKQISQEITDD